MKIKLGKFGSKILHSRSFKLLIAFLIIFSVVMIMYHNAQSPAAGIISNPDNIKQEPVKATPKPSHYKGSSFTFDYPIDFATIKNNPPSGLITEQLSMLAQSGVQNTRRVSITIKQFGSGVAMAEDAAYKLRLQDTSNYIHETVNIKGADAEIFSKKDKTEITYFMRGSDYYATIAGTSSYGSQKLSDDMSMIVNSFSWLK